MEKDDQDDMDDFEFGENEEGVGYREIEIREQDRYLPIANIARIMKRVLPGNSKIAKDAKESIQACVSEFISFITSEASDKCQLEKRKTINGDDLLWAMGTLGFDQYGEPLRIYLAKYRESVKGEKPDKKTGKAEKTHATTVSVAKMQQVLKYQAQMQQQMQNSTTSKPASSANNTSISNSTLTTLNATSSNASATTATTTVVESLTPEQFAALTPVQQAEWVSYLEQRAAYQRQVEAHQQYLASQQATAPATTAQPAVNSAMAASTEINTTTITASETVSTAASSISTTAGELPTSVFVPSPEPAPAPTI